MLNVVLFEPEIPPNTGNIIRLCANTGFRLHLIEPLGFDIDDKRLRRAGLDYHEFADLHVWPDLDACVEFCQPENVWAMTTKVTRRYTDVSFKANDILLLGPETRGLPAEVIERFQGLTLPMKADSRSSTFLMPALL